MRRRGLQSLSNERGAILVFALLVVVFLLVAGGLAVDFAHMFLADKELEKSMDAAALAGAGKLGFNSDAFPTARQFSQIFANRNSYRIGTVDLNPNEANAVPPLDSVEAPYGDIVLGVWNPTLPQGVGAGLRFEPSLDGTVVNAVMCRYKAQVNTSLFRLWGINTMPVSAVAIATANPPANPPPDGCLFPIGVGSCPFQGDTSLGCGSTITFITSSGNDEGAGCLAPPCTNSSAWVNLDGGSVNTGYLRNAIEGAAAGTCPTTDLSVSDTIPTGNGMNQAVMDTLEEAFIAKYAESANEPVSITDPDGNTTYEGQGWKVFIPVIQTDCPAGAISGGHTIIGWTEFVMAQVINRGRCAVDNPWPGPWDPIGTGPHCTGNEAPSNVGALRAIFGYYSCTYIPSPPVPTPVPRTALATKLQLVR